MEPVDKLELGVDAYISTTNLDDNLDDNFMLSFFGKYELSESLHLTLDINDLDSDNSLEFGTELNLNKINAQIKYDINTEALYLRAETDLVTDTKIYTGYLVDVLRDDNHYFNDNATTSGFTELGIEITKQLQITSVKSFPITGKLVYNPTNDETFFGVNVKVL